MQMSVVCCIKGNGQFWTRTNFQMHQSTQRINMHTHLLFSCFFHSPPPRVLLCFFGLFSSVHLNSSVSPFSSASLYVSLPPQRCGVFHRDTMSRAEQIRQEEAGLAQCPAAPVISLLGMNLMLICMITRRWPASRPASQPATASLPTAKCTQDDYRKMTDYTHTQHLHRGTHDL